FFFSSRRRHTRSLRDWSSDVCSSDLDFRLVGFEIRDIFLQRARRCARSCDKTRERQKLIAPLVILVDALFQHLAECVPNLGISRSEERRVGKEWRSRWETDQ